MTSDIRCICPPKCEGCKSALIEPGVVIGAESEIGHNVVIHAGSTIGERCVIRANTVIAAKVLVLSKTRMDLAEISTLGQCAIGNDGNWCTQ